MNYIIPTWDRFRSEYTQIADNLLHHLTGFTGSLGILIIDDQQEKHLFVDSRYTLQAENECFKDIKIHDYKHWKTFIKPEVNVTVDPWLWTKSELEGLSHIHYEHLLDRFWPNKPKRQVYKTAEYKKYTDSSASKIQRVCKYLEKEKADALLITDADSVSWLLNIRSFDKPYSLAIENYCTIYADGSVDEQPKKVKHLVIDSMAPLAIYQKFPHAKARPNPITLMKACKSPIELEGFKNSHQQDGLAIRKFLSWLSETNDTFTEISAAEELLSFRKEQKDFIAPSFPTISAVADHGAIVHYRAKTETNRTLTPGDIYLVDSGGHYYGGTTDVTRTILYKANTAPFEIKENFTLVLKGFLALMTAVFPKDTTGIQLDTLARQFLWRKHRNYGHGTGHGVGSCLNVHESPPSISPKASTTPLQPGMVVSIEPGFYKTNAYGIRIENLAYVEALDEDWYHFQNLTQAPIDTNLIATELLTLEEKKWIEKIFML